MVERLLPTHLRSIAVLCVSLRAREVNRIVVMGVTRVPVIHLDSFVASLRLTSQGQAASVLLLRVALGGLAILSSAVADAFITGEVFNS